MGVNPNPPPVAETVASTPSRGGDRWLVKWLVGVAVGTLLVGVFSPLTTRSYLPNQISRNGIQTLPTGYTYRWRSEGYANTRIGPFGMPGKTKLDSGSQIIGSGNQRIRSGNQRIRSGNQRLALWGDSQAEGVCVSDQNKLFAQIEKASQNRFEVLPFAKSGDAIGDWIAQIPWAESEAGIDHHLFFIVDLEDLADLSPPDPPTQGRFGGITALIPSFVVTAVRNIAMDPKGGVRTLRFSVGPVTKNKNLKTKTPSKQSLENTPSGPSADSNAKSMLQDAETAIKRLTAISDRPITIVYAPPRPLIVGGKIVWTDSNEDLARTIRKLAESNSIQWLDATEVLRKLAQKGRFPHGFPNGQIGAGHLNEAGNHALATWIVDWISIDQQKASKVSL